MAGLDKSSPQPTRIVVHQQSRLLEIEFDDGKRFRLSFEFLRVHSPSAEVRGHGPGQEVLQTGKREVGIEAIDPVGHYAIQPRFSDGHSSGLYSWDYLYFLGTQEARLWQDYLLKLQQAGASRDPEGGALGGSRTAADAAPAAAPGAPGSASPMNISEARRRPS